MLIEVKAIKRTFGFFVRLTVEVKDGAIDIRNGINRTSAPIQAVEYAATERKRHGLRMRTTISLVGAGAVLGSVELSPNQYKAGDEAAKWINELIQKGA